MSYVTFWGANPERLAPPSTRISRQVSLDDHPGTVKENAPAIPVTHDWKGEDCKCVRKASLIATLSKSNEGKWRMEIEYI